MSRLLIKRSNANIDELTTSLSYGELGLCQNKLYFGDSNNDNIEVALARNVKMLDAIPLSRPATKRLNGLVFPVQYDKNGNLAVCTPYISDTPANSKRIIILRDEWQQVGTNNFKLQINTGFKDINYAVEILEVLQDGTTFQNVECVKNRINDESGVLYLYSTHKFNGCVIITSGGNSVFYGNELPDIRYIRFEPNRITEVTSFKEITITGKLKFELIGKNILAGDVIELCVKRLQSGTEISRRYRLRPVFKYTLSQQDITSRILEIPFACRLDKLLRYAKCPNNDGVYYPRQYYPLHLRIKRSDEYGHQAYYSLPIQLHPHYTIPQMIEKNGVLQQGGGWFSLT